MACCPGLTFSPYNTFLNTVLYWTMDYSTHVDHKDFFYTGIFELGKIFSFVILLGKKCTYPVCEYKILLPVWSPQSLEVSNSQNNNGFRTTWNCSVFHGIFVWFAEFSHLPSIFSVHQTQHSVSISSPPCHWAVIPLTMLFLSLSQPTQVSVAYQLTCVTWGQLSLDD